MSAKSAIWLIFLIAIINAGPINAQETNLRETSDEMKKSFQFTFIYPMGTNGSLSGQISNNFSVNLLAGVNGGVNAFEFGAFANINHGDVSGFQLAGFTNINIGNTRALQIGGFYNQNKEFNGSQIAGFLNNNIGNSNGLQLAGFANISNGYFEGCQLAGFINTNTSLANGVQIAGFTNITGGNSKGVQIAGFSNVSNDINGFQLAGFINIAHKVKGMQLSFINFADSVEGLSFGFISIVRNGYHRAEISVNESLFSNLSFKIGLNQLYNIFTGGFKQSNSDLYWSFGYGIGSVIAISPRMNINIDAVCQQVIKNSWQFEYLNLLNSLRINASFKLGKRIELAAGPTFNVLVSDILYSEEIGSVDEYVPYCFYDEVHGHYSIKMFPGFNAAIRF